MSARGQREWFAGATDVGLIRSGNEDSWLAEPPLFAVADGLGGHQAGEVASSIALEVLVEETPATPDINALDQAVQAANLAVMDAAREGKGRSGMGTTLTAVVLDGTRLLVSHVGDSRAYLFHDGELVRVTQDHSMVADMIREGTLTEEEARYHPNRSVITRALGTNPEMLPDTFETVASRGDRLLLSTDGLHGQVTDPEIADIVRNAASPSDAAKALVSAANDAGGVDNVTVIVVDIGETSRGTAATTAAESSARRKEASGQLARTWIARAAWVVAAVSVVAIAWFGFQYWVYSQAFLRVDSQGKVAIYTGVAEDFAGLRLSRLAQPTEVVVEKLPVNLQGKLTSSQGVKQSSLAEARQTVAEYERLASISSSGTVDPTTPTLTEPAPAPSTTTTP